jgi:hypothetical protein
VSKEPVTWLPSRSPPGVERWQQLRARLVTALFADLLGGEAQEVEQHPRLTRAECKEARRRRAKRADAVNRLIVVTAQALTVLVIGFTAAVVFLIGLAVALWVRALVGLGSAPVSLRIAAWCAGAGFGVSFSCLKAWNQLRKTAIRRSAAKP